MQPDVRRQAWCRRLRERAGVGKSRPRVGGSDLSKYPTTSWLSLRHRPPRLLALRAISATAGRRLGGGDGGGREIFPKLDKTWPGAWVPVILTLGLFCFLVKRPQISS